jgi:hypothetical protein
MVEEMDSYMTYLIHYNNLHKCHNVPPPITTIKGKKMTNIKKEYLVICYKLIKPQRQKKEIFYSPELILILITTIIWNKEQMLICK